MNNEKDFVEKMAEAPAVALEKTIEATESVAKAITDKKPIQEVKDYWHNLGPGLTTGAADDDPSGIATYSQTGARYGFQLLWLAGLTFPLMAVVQEMCARIGLVTGRGLAANIKAHFPRPVIYICTILLFAANTFNIGADLGAMAQATQLIMPSFSFPILITFITILSLLLQIFISYGNYAKYLKWLALLLVSYIFSALSVHIDWGEVLHQAVIPSFTFDKDQIIMICAILGTTISPYLFFWQTSQEIEEEILDGKTTIADRRGTTDKDIKNMRIDVWSGMFVSNLVMFFIIAACAATLHNFGITNIATAADAAIALQPFAGNSAYLLFALGIIGTGMLAVPVLAGSASYAISESFGWKQGLYRKLRQAYAFYGVIIASMLIGLLINFSGLDPFKALIYSAVANGFVAPIVLALIVLISASKKIMGDRANSPLTTTIGWLVTSIMILASLATIFSLLS